MVTTARTVRATAAVTTARTVRATAALARRELKLLYEQDELDDEQMAERLNITRSQLQTQLRRLFKERQLTPRPRRRARKTSTT